VEYHAAINNPGALKTAFRVMMDNAGPAWPEEKIPGHADAPGK
jgi:hypothetical protein